jgi:hypothetical protein
VDNPAARTDGQHPARWNEPLGNENRVTLWATGVGVGAYCSDCKIKQSLAEALKQQGHTVVSELQRLFDCVLSQKPEVNSALIQLFNNLVCLQAAQYKTSWIVWSPYTSDGWD